MAKQLAKFCQKTMLVVCMISLLVPMGLEPLVSSNTLTGAQILEQCQTHRAETQGTETRKIDEENLAVMEPVMLDVQRMNQVQKQKVVKTVHEAVTALKLPTQQDEFVYEEAVLSVFDSKSINYQNVQGATNTLIKQLTENHKTIFDGLTGEKILAAKHGAISTSFLGTVLDVAIGMALGGGLGAALTLARRKGVKYVKKRLMSHLKGTLANIGLKRASKFILAGLEIALGHYSPGKYLARWVDRRDKIRNNGWIELW